MPDLDAQIRAELAQARTPFAIIETPEPLSPAEYDDLVARFRAAQLRAHEEMRVIPRSLVDRMRDALLAVLEGHTPNDDGSGIRNVCSTCAEPSMGWERESESWPCSTVLAIAKELGIEASE